MTRLWLLALCLLTAVSRADGPLLQARVQLQPGDSALVGQTVTLQLDVLTDTWFANAPRLPVLTLAGALVQPPGDQAQHLTLQQNGKALFGMRYRYLITPRQVGTLAIPALTISAQPGQATATLSASTAPVVLTVNLPAGAVSGQMPLVASDVSLSQTVIYSSKALKVGDSLTRTLTLRAEGVPAMALAAPAWGAVPGLVPYPGAPRLNRLDDGRGDAHGGQRTDQVAYRVERGGHYQLPAVNLMWWDLHGQPHYASVPAVSFEASDDAAYRTVFSLPRRWPWGWLALLVVLLGAGWSVYLQRRRLIAPLARWRAGWYASAASARYRAAVQLRQSPVQLTALYLWQQRRRHCLSLDAPDALAHRYGAHADGQLRPLRRLLHHTRAPHDGPPTPALRPLNPWPDKEPS